MIKAEIILDSINSANGSRITSWILEYPRFVHAEFMTHRMFSKNSASSRAIPIEKMIQQVLDNPAIPVWWGKNQSGMQANEELDDVQKSFRPYGAESDQTDKKYAETLWFRARNHAVDTVREMSKLGLHKQIANRILEPWFHIRVIMTATEIQNFFALRVHKDAQPEIRTLAEKMLEEYNKSEPQVLKPYEWHIPFGKDIDESRLWKALGLEDEDMEEGAGDFLSMRRLNKILDEGRIKIAVARCARVSYFNFEGKDDYEADIKLCERLFANNPKHLSPTEHVAQATDTNEFIGNFRGWRQYRKFFTAENLKDDRVIEKFQLSI